MVHPDFQRQGHGKLLTKHCNAIADHENCITNASARHTAVNMFKSCGFKELGIFYAHAERWGEEYSEKKSRYYMLKREAKSSQ